MSYKDYIKGFTWNTLKYSTKRSLLELTALITKVSAWSSLTEIFPEYALKWWINKEEPWRVILAQVKNSIDDKEGRRQSPNEGLYRWYIQQKSIERPLCGNTRLRLICEHACCAQLSQSSRIHGEDGRNDEWLLRLRWCKWSQEVRRQSKDWIHTTQGVACIGK